VCRYVNVTQEVHDVAGRLKSIVSLLKEHGFQDVIAEQQLSEVSEDGYLSYVPHELELYMVYAKRACV
jgi:hypothetical protein